MKLLLTFLLIGLPLLGAEKTSAIPERPERLTYPPLNYEPPNPADYRVELSSGPVAYIVPDKELPLVTINIYVRTGDYVVPEGYEGLAGFTGYLLTRGGTESKTAEELDERLAFLAANLSSGVGDNQGSVSLNLLSKDIDEGLSILREVLTQPRFQENRFELYKRQTLQNMKQRNDDSSSIEARERGFLAFGEDFWANSHSTAASIEKITQSDLKEFHKKWFHPANFVVAASGDFDKNQMKARLEKLFSDWPFQGATPASIPTNTTFAKPGFYIVDKEVNQGRVSIMLPGVMRDHPDYFSIMVMNDILGGGGFTSHIVNRVRSDEGLAYSAGSSFPGGVYYPLSFIAGFQTKSRTVAYAISLVLEEIENMRKKEVSPDELVLSKTSFIERFPRNFTTETQTANTFAQDEFTGRYKKDPNFWKEYRSRVEKVTARDVQRVADKYLTLDKLVVLVVGQKEEIMKGHPNHDVSITKLANNRIIDVPLRDPLTMKPIK